MKIEWAIPPGVVSDDTTFASKGRWADGNNMRPWRGSMQTIGGWSKLTDGIEGVCRAVLPWTDNAGYVSLAFGSHTHLQVHVNGILYDITPTTGFTAGAEDGAGGPGYSAGGYGEGGYGEDSPEDYFPLTWSLANWGEWLLANPRNQSLFVWQNNTASPAAVVSAAPDNITSMVMSPVVRQVLALGCNAVVSGTFNPMTIRGCDFEDYTDWTPTSANNSFEFTLPGSGRIVTGRFIGQYLAIWTDNALYMGQFTAIPNDPWRFDLVDVNCGLIGPNAVKAIGQTAIWISPDYQFHTWSPGGVRKLANCPIRNDFKDNMAVGQFEKIAATSVGQFGEVWFFYPDARDGLECSRYVAVSSEDGQWFRGREARSGVVDAGSTQFPLFVTPDGTAYWHENGQTADGAPLSWSLTTADTYFDKAQKVMLVRGIWHDFEDQRGGVNLTLRLRAFPQSAQVREKGPYLLAADRSKRDFMATGRVVAAEFSGSSSPAFVRFGKPVWDAVPAGEF